MSIPRSLAPRRTGDVPPAIAREAAPAPALDRLPERYRALLVIVPALGLLAGLASRLLGAGEWSGWIWAAATLPVLAVLLVEIVVSLRRGDVGLDIVAALSMAAAVGFGETLAACVVALMYAGGQYLESFAERQARRQMTALLSRVPRTAMRYANGGLEEIALEAIMPSDRLLIRQGDVVPVDGATGAGIAVLDQAALTGESLPVHRRSGEEVMSGSTNVGEAFDLLASRTAADSTYAGIVRLVEAAQRSKAPMSRLADRFALVFLGVTLAIAGAAWLLTGDVIRAVAVLVIATPCPLILAVPVAIFSGVSRAARIGVLIKGGRALEGLAKIRSVVIDKTGTLTEGQARLASVVTNGVSRDELLRVAASLDQASQHPIAQALVTAAHDAGLALTSPEAVVETSGEGIEGLVSGRRVAVGGRRFIAAKAKDGHELPLPPLSQSSVIVGVAIDGQIAGELAFADGLRPETLGVLQSLRELGIERIVLATGDRREVAEEIAARLPIDLVRAELTPDQKTMTVLSERKSGPVMMIGDGVNDAPALAAADIGVAMGAKGAAASAEAADVVLLVDELGRIVPAIRIARRSRFIALESVVAGIGLSVLGMIAAAFGYLSPVQGAFAQEAIDVAVILNALRALR